MKCIAISKSLNFLYVMFETLDNSCPIGFQSWYRGGQVCVVIVSLVAGFLTETLNRLNYMAFRTILIKNIGSSSKKLKLQLVNVYRGIFSCPIHGNFQCKDSGDTKVQYWNLQLSMSWWSHYFISSSRLSPLLVKRQDNWYKSSTIIFCDMPRPWKYKREIWNLFKLTVIFS